MAREQCPVCSASDIEEIIALDDYPHAGGGIVVKEKADEVSTGTLSIGICRVCGFLFQYEPVSLEMLDEMAHRQPPPLPPSETSVGLADANRFLKALKRYAPKKGRALDIGCGAGYTLAALREMGFEAEGVDARPEAVKLAEDRGFKVKLGRFETDMFPDERYDLVVARSVLEHTIDPLTLLSTMVNLLKPGGILALGTLNMDHVIHRCTFGGFTFHRGSYWSSPTLRYALTLQGLDLLGGYEETEIAMFGKKADKGEDEVEPVPPPSDFLDSIYDEVDEFLERKERIADMLPDMIASRFPDGITVLGAGVATVDMLYYTGMFDQIKKVVTTNKKRYGAVLGGSDLVVHPFENVKPAARDVIMITSEKHQELMMDRLEPHLDKGARVIRYSPEIEII